jgi:hypothetical protein
MPDTTPKRADVRRDALERGVAKLEEKLAASPNDPSATRWRETLAEYRVSLSNIELHGRETPLAGASPGEGQQRIDNLLASRDKMLARITADPGSIMVARWQEKIAEYDASLANIEAHCSEVPPGVVGALIEVPTLNLAVKEGA